MSNRITTSTCNDCSARAPGVEHYHNGAPTMFLCKHCSPKAFEAVARKNIDAYLSGSDEEFSQ
jgi:hypothetical protein